MEFTFKINGISPSEMNFSNLVDYYSELKKIVGDVSDLRLVGVNEGSHESALVSVNSDDSLLIDRLEGIASGNGPEGAKSAYSRLNEMLWQNGLTAEFLNQNREKIVIFPGKKPTVFDPVVLEDDADVVGEVVNIRGVRGKVRFGIRTDDFGSITCDADKPLGKRLASLLFENVRLFGRATWVQREVGGWDIQNFHITSFAALSNHGLRAEVDSIRALTKDWPEDLLDKMAAADLDDED